MSIILLQSSSSPLRLITSSAKLNIVIKKKIEDCSVVAARLHAICDDILWVLTHAQLQAVAGFAKSVVQVVEKCKKSEPAPSVVSHSSLKSCRGFAPKIIQNNARKWPAIMSMQSNEYTVISAFCSEGSRRSICVGCRTGVLKCAEVAEEAPAIE